MSATVQQDKQSCSQAHGRAGGGLRAAPPGRTLGPQGSDPQATFVTMENGGPGATESMGFKATLPHHPENASQEKLAWRLLVRLCCGSCHAVCHECHSTELWTQVRAVPVPTREPSREQQGITHSMEVALPCARSSPWVGDLCGHGISTQNPSCKGGRKGRKGCCREDTTQGEEVTPSACTGLDAAGTCASQRGTRPCGQGPGITGLECPKQ